jgi:hypothetical protein
MSRDKLQLLHDSVKHIKTGFRGGKRTDFVVFAVRWLWTIGIVASEGLMAGGVTEGDDMLAGKWQITEKRQSPEKKRPKRMRTGRPQCGHVIR